MIKRLEEGTVPMDELALRRKKLFAGSVFKAALFYSGDEAGKPTPSFLYFSGCAVDGCYLLLKPGKGMLLAHGMNHGMAKKVSHYPVRLLGKERAGEIGKACGRGNVGFSAGEMSAARYLALRKGAKLKLVDADARIASLRGAKSKSELALLSASAAIARGILDALDPWECKTEEELAARLKSRALEAGAEISFEPIVASGKNSSFPHHLPGATKLGDAVLVDFGVRYRGHCSDFTRCYFRKKGMKEEGAYLKCRDVFEEIVQGLGGCRKGKDVALLSERLLERHRLPKLMHAIGHGAGLEVHECPHLGKKSEDSLEGAVIAIEPAAYFPGYGVRFEGMVANTKKGWKRI